MQADRKAYLTTAFEALGPDRVARGLEARGHSWKDCFLALALGEIPGTLEKELKHCGSKEHAVSELLGVPVPVVSEVVTTWDRSEKAFRALAVEWLEANRTCSPTPRAALTPTGPRGTMRLTMSMWGT